MAYKSGNCYVCKESKALQDHHLLPLEYGGPKDGRQIKICPTCHLVCHYESDIYYKTGDYGELEVRFPDEKTRARAIKVISYIIQQRSQFEAGDAPAKDARRRVSFNVTHEELLLIHAAKKVQGFNSLERFVKGCVSAMLVEMRRKGRI